MIIPEAAKWLLRLATREPTAQRLQADSVIFSAWYAEIGSLITWPTEVQQIQDVQRKKRLTLERMTKLLSNVNYSLLGRSSAQHARRVLEGYEVHGWVVENNARFRFLVSESLRYMEVLPTTGSNQARLQFAARIAELARVLKLSPLESAIFSLAVVITVSEEMSGLIERLSGDKVSATALWRVMFDASSAELAQAMRADSPLRLSGILESSRWPIKFAEIPSTWVEILAAEDSLFDSILEPLPIQIGSGHPAKLIAEDFDFAVRLLRRPDAKGVNLLLYGPAALEKQELLQQVVKATGRTAYRVRRFDDASNHVLPSIAFTAFQLLAEKDPNSVLAIEHPSDVLETTPRLFRELFGFESDPERNVPFDKNLLSTNPVPGIWLSSDVSRLPSSTVAQFMFQAPLRKADRAEQDRALRSALEELKISAAGIESILSFDGISPAQLDAAMRAVRIAGYDENETLESAVLQAIRRSQRALSRNMSTDAKESVTSYSLNNLNTSGRFTPEQILRSFQKRPRGSLLLYGPPGTGKSQFVQYIARELDRPLVSKSASDLLSKWLGDTEKNLAAAFEEAAMEEGILFFDEGDSILRSRHLAEHSWEVTQTNELLQRMENFDGIVIVATNMFRNLDPAALRRFSFKVEFRELDAQQRWSMFITETGIASELEALDAKTQERWQDRLLLMRHLTPGDFATVKRQSTILDVVLTPEEWLEQLEIECEIKNSSGFETRTEVV